LVHRYQHFGATCCVLLQDAIISCVEIEVIEIEKVAESMAKREQITVDVTGTDVLEELAASIFTVQE
jgi:hypothetical protein